MKIECVFIINYAAAQIHILTGNILCLDSWSELSRLLRRSQSRRRPCLGGRPAGDIEDPWRDRGADQDHWTVRGPQHPSGARRPHCPQHKRMLSHQNRART